MRLLALILFLPGLLQAFTVTDRGTGGNNTTSEASTVCSPSGTIPAGSEGLLIIVADNANAAAGNMPSSITDSAGNTWTRIVNLTGSASANATMDIVWYSSRLTTNLTSGGNVTVTYTVAVTAKAYAFIQMTPGTAGNIFLARSLNASSGTSNTAAPTVNSVNACPGDLVVGVGGAESEDTWVGDADSLSGTWSTQQHAGFGTSVSGMSITSQYKTVTATNNQVYNPTLTIADVRLSTMVFVEASPKARMAFGNIIGETTSTFTFMESMSVGSTAILFWGGKNSGLNGDQINLPSTLSDLAGNTWTRQQDGLYDPGIAAAGCEIGIYTCTLTNAVIARNTTISIVYPATCNSKNVVVFEMTDSTGYANSGLGTGSTTGTPSVTTTSPITNGNYAFGVVEVEGTVVITPDSDTSNGSWVSLGNDNANHTILAQYKKVTATGTQTFNPTYTSNDTMLGWAELTVPSAATTTKVPAVPALPAHPSL